GGEERYQSSQKALDYINKKKIKNVFIHDAARPNFSINLLKKLKKNLKKNKAVIPYINTDHSTKYKNKNKIINLNREKVLLTQTPQCFDFKTLYKLSNDRLCFNPYENIFICTKHQKEKFREKYYELFTIVENNNLNKD
ncbi:MAG: 2-C-methyl-D-erythritol 4-phosphate cytidylyltransferase, partial [Candidatus Woesearchaeota archaeon]|nr:2-C-methyl-D-erythritol 4-phosphate cytidylyltransferase [Candidatus Woesearchaeota archaeon]